MQTGYFKTAWNDIKHSDGWVGKVILLTLLQIIPIFGQIVSYGYLYGWARDIAWNVHAPLPKRIFGNEDGKLYSRGFFTLVIAIVFALIPYVIMIGYMIIAGVSTGSAAMMSQSGSSAALPTNVFFVSIVGILVYFLCIVLFLAAGIFAWVGNMRMSVYGKLGPGLQFGKIWAMMRHDFGGLMRIFGMGLIVGFILSAIISVVVSIVIFILIFAAIAGGAMSGTMTSGDSSQILGAIIFSPVGVIAILLYFAMILVSLAAGTFIQMLITRALGYWTRNFDVAEWGGSKEPMPFQVKQAAGYGAGAPAAAGAQPAPGTPFMQTSQTAPVSTESPAVPVVPIQDGSNAAVQDSVNSDAGSTTPDSIQSGNDEKKKEE